MVRLQYFSILLILAPLLFCQPSFSQQKGKAKKLDFCGIKIKDLDKEKAAYQEELDFLRLQEYDSVVDVGAGSGWYEGVLSVLSPLQHLHFFLVDINVDCLNETKVNNMKTYYSLQKGDTITNRFTIINNTVDSLYLPANRFKKVWIMNTLHEIPDRAKMVRDMYHVLQSGGEVLVLEMFARKEHELHGGCRKPLFSRQELDQLFTSHQFTVKDHIEMKINRRATFQIVRYIKN